MPESSNIYMYIYTNKIIDMAIYIKEGLKNYQEAL